MTQASDVLLRGRWPGRLLRCRVLVPAIGAALFAAALLFYDTGQVPSFINEISLRSLALALGLLLANQLLAGVRFHFLLRDYGIRQGLGRSIRINTASVFGGLLFTSFFGQSVTRAVLIGRIGQSQAVAFVLTGLERAVAVTLLLCLAIACALYVFGGIDVHTADAASLVLLILMLVAVTTSVVWAGLRRRQRQVLLQALRNDIAGPAIRAAGITLLMHAAMLGAYVTLARAVAPDATMTSLLAVSTVVMFAAAIPISPAGWGVRELTAAQAFGVIAIAPEAGLVVALGIGLLSLVALGLVAVAATPFVMDGEQRPVDRTIDTATADRLVRLVGWGTPAVCAALVHFQVQLPTASGGINVNLGDPFAILGALTLLSLSIAGQGWRKLWRVPHVNAALAASALVMGLGFLHGVAEFGLTDWALFNRLIGFAILISFFLTGALAATVGHRAGVSLLCRVFVVAAAAIVATEFGLRWADDLVQAQLFDWPRPSRFEGLAGNPNAFAAQLALAAAVAMPVSCLFGRRRANLVEFVVVGLFSLGIFLSASRAAWIAVACMLVLYFLMGRLDWGRLTKGLVGAGFAIGVIALAGQGGELHANPAQYNAAAQDNNLLLVYGDRWSSLVDGFHMWLAHPVLGAGLGAFMQQQLEATGTPLVIHNTTLWLAAELGIVGLAVIAFLPVVLARRLVMDRAWRHDWWPTVLLGCFCVIGLMSLVHELFYQRALWLLAGALLAAPGALRSPKPSGAT